MIRLLDTLASFSFDVHHRPGTHHGNADALSRATHHPEIAFEETPEAEVTGLAVVAETAAADANHVADTTRMSQTLSKSPTFSHKNQNESLSIDLPHLSPSNVVNGQHATDQIVNKSTSGQQGATSEMMKNHPETIDTS